MFVYNNTRNDALPSLSFVWWWIVHRASGPEVGTWVKSHQQIFTSACLPREIHHLPASLTGSCTDTRNISRNQEREAGHNHNVSPTWGLCIWCDSSSQKYPQCRMLPLNGWIWHFSFCSLASRLRKLSVSFISHKTYLRGIYVIGSFHRYQA